MTTIRRLAAGFVAGLFLAQAGVARAAEIKVLSVEALRSVFNDLARDFERVSGDKVVVDYATGGIVAKRIKDGERNDVVILTRSLFTPLVNGGSIATDGSTRLARSLLAIAVPAGAPKPDIGTVEALKRTLVAAKSITYPDPTKGGQIGVMAAGLVERLGLTEQLKSKTTLTIAGEFRELLARREAELAILVPIVIANNRAIDLVGPVPQEVQVSADFDFMIGTDAHAKEPAAAKKLIQFLASPDAARMMKAKGLEPG